MFGMGPRAPRAPPAEGAGRAVVQDSHVTTRSPRRTATRSSPAGPRPAHLQCPMTQLSPPRPGQKQNSSGKRNLAAGLKHSIFRIS